MVDTRRIAVGALGASPSGAGNEDRDPPPPPPPSYTAEQFFAQFLGSQCNMEAMQQNMEAALCNIADNTHRGMNQGGHEVNQYSTFKDFMDTKPPIFKEAAELLEANEWINTMEKKFCLLRLTETLKTEYVAHQLQGPIGIWWSHHRNTYPTNAQITWAQFTTAFCGNYIPLGLMAMKVGEFMKLTQGTKTMTEYLHAFNNLSRYATEFVDTETKKIASFKRGIGPKMLKSVGTSTRIVFNDFISDCLTQENNNNLYAASKNRKRAFESRSFIDKSSYGKSSSVPSA
ncbi:uncharacterized protein [Miscanthus floridulus]|uniref:uncharacterized protein n=1 Tax=Miscanthus floridulus TaxID=154761 RepID=UPI0034584FA7